MKRSLLAALAALFFLSGCAARGPDSGPAVQPSQSTAASSAVQSAPEPPAPTPSEEPAVPDTPEERARALLADMTLEEKAGQLFFARCPAENAAQDVSAYHLGGYILFGRDTKGKTACGLIRDIASYQEAADIPLLIGVDEEGGSVVRVSSNSNLREQKFQSPRAVYSAGGIDGVLADAHEKDLLLRGLGFNVNLAPVADVSTDPGDFIYDRTLGEDAQTTAGYVSAVTEQMARDGMGSVLKHFPGYGNNPDTHTGSAVDDRPLETFQTSDFLPFSAGLSGSRTAAVLVSHNIVRCMDPELPASLSPAVHQTLRELMTQAGRTNGVVMTDDLAMDAVKLYAQDGSAAVLAVQAGNDLLISSDYRAQIPQVLAAAQDGTLDTALIDAACLRVLTWKAELGLL